MKMNLKTIDNFLRRFSLNGKDVAVVGPNYYLMDDPSLLYFVNRMAGKPGTLTVIDAKPHVRPASHGDIYKHLADLESMVEKGVHIKKPAVIIEDVTRLMIRDKFDLIFETGTFKCILNDKTGRGCTSYLSVAEKVLNAYDRMLRQHGTVIFTYADVFTDVGYSTLIELLYSSRDRFSFGLCTKLADRYIIRNINKEKVRRHGRRQLTADGKYLSTRIKLDDNGHVTLGSSYANMHLIFATKDHS